ncbi:MAG: prolyl oligopeptidase family serine peptidase [Archangium sp.]|nr:prolyl oligopeptidase family serine peptidase [Archangium sp.]MDP3570230.1 prolyl oligopeptidase family serine peptidase [Archangium sp.]
MRTPFSLLGLSLLSACTSSNTATTAPPAAQPAPVVATAAPPPLKVEDPHLWLEEVNGEKQIAWVKERNAVSQKELESAPGFSELRTRLKAIYDSKDRIPKVNAQGKFLYNFWKDEAHPRGLWRRTSLTEYRKPAPNWELVLDLDALGAAEKQSWVWHGSQCLPPKYERCLVSLSPGGSDAEVVREFDVVKKAFVEGGFTLPEAKSQVGWKDLDTLYVATDFGPGTLTTSGYPRIVKEWRRGTPLSDAKLLLEGEAADVSVYGYREFDHGKTRDWVGRARTFFTEEVWLREGEKLVKIDKPDDAAVSAWDDQLLLRLRSDWVINEKIYKAGSLLAIPLEAMKAGKRDFAVLFEPSPTTSLDAFVGTKTAMIITVLDDVKSVVFVATRSKKGWEQKKLETPKVGTFAVDAYDRDLNDDYWFYDAGFTTPSSLSLGSLNKPKRELIKTSPAFFKAEGLEVTQHFAVSKDSTKVPYFQVAKAGLTLDGTTPTLLEGYGGFEVSLTPYYDATVGAAWLERGGVFALANIRGGGEYGPAWHRAALTHNRQRAYDDFAAVAEDLISRKVTSSTKLGILGGSNGGLLMGVMLTQRPELFGAIVCQVPLLDMKRYHLLLAGASWMEEYGDPGKPDDWLALSQFSPYQNVKAGKKYPRTLFTTSTKDDRVHPGHARKMVARLLENGADILYYENIEGGHGGAADNAQKAQMNALAFTFLARQLGLP